MYDQFALVGRSGGVRDGSAYAFGAKPTRNTDAIKSGIGRGFGDMRGGLVMVCVARAREMRSRKSDVMRNWDANPAKNDGASSSRPVMSFGSGTVRARELPLVKAQTSTNGAGGLESTPQTFAGIGRSTAWLLLLTSTVRLCSSPNSSPAREQICATLVKVRRRRLDLPGRTFE